MKVVYLSDQHYYCDEEGRWYTTASFPLPELMSAFAHPPRRWTFFGRLSKTAGDASRFYPITMPEGVEVEFRGPYGDVQGLGGYLVGLSRYAALVKESIRDADIVWAKLPFVASLLALLHRPQNGFYVTHLVGDPGDTLERRGGHFWHTVARLSRSLNRRAMANAHACLFVSEDLRRRYAPSGMDTEIVHEGRISRNHLASGFKRKNIDLPVVLYVGRLCAEKGVDVLIRAMARVRKLVDLRLRIVGDGAQKEELQSLVSTLDLEDVVTFAGPVRWGGDLFAEIRAATCLALPSYTEGFPLVVLEGLSQGTPVISSDVGGVRELVMSGQSAIIVPAGDETALATALLQVVSDPVLQEWLATEGLQLARENTLERQVERLRPIFASAIKVVR